MLQTHEIQGMHCAACTHKVTAALERLPGVVRAAVSLAPPLATIETREDVPRHLLQAAVASAGPYHLFEPVHGPKPTIESAPKESLYPLLLIVAFLVGTVLLVEAGSGAFSLHRAMRNFMAGFFLVFSFFKLLDLRGFASAYRSYDLLAQVLPGWSWCYPFIELGLGVLYLLNWRPIVINAVTLLVMLIGATGVLQSLLQKRVIRCACLGTVVNLPMTTVTLVEDLGMAAMAAVMLFLW